MAEELTEKDVIRAHARDELGIDMDELANPLQAALVSALAFTLGAIIPLLGGVFLADYLTRIIVVTIASALGLALFGAVGSILGGARYLIGTVRVVFGGLAAMAITYGAGRLFNVSI